MDRAIAAVAAGAAGHAGQLCGQLFTNKPGRTQASVPLQFLRDVFAARLTGRLLHAGLHALGIQRLHASVFAWRRLFIGAAARWVWERKGRRQHVFAWRRLFICAAARWVWE